MRQRPDPSRILFFVSLAMLAFLYGFATSARGWFPNDLLVEAWQQAGSLLEEEVPHFLQPPVYDYHGIRAPHPERIHPGYTFVSSMHRTGETWGPQLMLIDREGRTVHEWPLDTYAAFDDVQPGHPAYGVNLNAAAIHGAEVLPNGDLILNYEALATLRLDACGEILWQGPYGSHHSVAPDEDGSFWVSAHFDSTEERQFAGLGRPSIQDRILHLDGAGEVIEEIDVLQLLLDNDLGYRIARSRRFGTKEDLTHMNDVERLGESRAAEYPMFDAGDLMISLKRLDLVLIVDPESGRIKWQYGGRLHAQHDPDFLGDGWIGIFNNRPDGTRRGTMLGGSQIVAIHPETDSVRVLYPTPASDPFYTEYMGKWQPLPNGNLLLTESVPARIVEVAPGGETIWEWVQQPTEINGEGWVPAVSDAVRYDYTPEQVRSWPCAPAEG
jgi:hypothetical protein